MTYCSVRVFVYGFSCRVRVFGRFIGSYDRSLAVLAARVPRSAAPGALPAAAGQMVEERAQWTMSGHFILMGAMILKIVK